MVPLSYKIYENEEKKLLRSENYSYDFSKVTGFFARWGKTVEDDPDFSPFGPEIMDLEISVNGCPNNCPFCYKGNSNEAPTNMSFETFKIIFDKFLIPAKLIELEDGRKIKLAGVVKLKDGSVVKVEDLKPGDDLDI